MTKRIRLLICDDHIAIITGLTALLKSFPVNIVGTVYSSTKILSEFARTKPDVVLMDVRFEPDTPTGLEITEQLLAKHPDARVVIYSQFDSDEVIKAAYRLKSCAFIPKDSNPQVLFEAIQRANEGKYYFLPSISERLARLGLQEDTSPQAKLTEREFAMFKLLAVGATHEEIAEELQLSIRSLSALNTTIKQKLGVEKPAEITLLAVKHNVIKP